MLQTKAHHQLGTARNAFGEVAEETGDWVAQWVANWVARRQVEGGLQDLPPAGTRQKRWPVQRRRQLEGRRIMVTDHAFKGQGGEDRVPAAQDQGMPSA